MSAGRTINTASQNWGTPHKYVSAVKKVFGGHIDLDTGKGAPMACAMIYWGNNPIQFYEVFIEHGAVVDISNLIGEEIGIDRKKLKLFQV